MEKYKICPVCKEKNAPNLFECVYCETDLTGVGITDEETEKMRSEVNLQPSRYVRVCECGEKNAPNSRKCAACGEDISDIVPTPDHSAEHDNAAFVLSSLDGQYAFEVRAEETIIGREQAMKEYLEKKGYVSREHAKLTCTADGLYIENLSRTNFTFVNHNQITGKTQLQDGDVIGLGDSGADGRELAKAAYFLVRIGACT